VTYKNMRLVSTRVPWEWVGEVHEYVQRKGDGGSRPHLEVPGVWFFHDASGGNDGKRFVRDEVILSRVSVDTVIANQGYANQGCANQGYANQGYANQGVYKPRGIQTLRSSSQG
jgi:hypothetical protein